MISCARTLTFATIAAGLLTLTASAQQPPFHLLEATIDGEGGTLERGAFLQFGGAGDDGQQPRAEFAFLGGEGDREGVESGSDRLQPEGVHCAQPEPHVRGPGGGQDGVKKRKNVAAGTAWITNTALT